MTCFLQKEIDLFLNKLRISTPGMNLTIDEAKCPFTGIINFEVYTKNKPNSMVLDWNAPVPRLK